MTTVQNNNSGLAKRFLVVGCGSIGQRHISNLSAAKVNDVIAFDIRADRRNDVSSTLGIETVGTMDEAWRCEPDVVVITVPTSLHIPVALEAASRGCHLFIEKPLSHCWDGVNCLLDRVSQRKLVTLVGCNMRFHPGLATVKRLLTEQKVGRVIAARVEVGQYLPDWHPWEDYRQSYSARSDLGGGVILDAIHEIDYIRWLLGEVSGAICLAGKLSGLEIETEDTAAILIRFESGAIGEVHLDYVQRAYSRTCQIVGEEGTLHWDYILGQVRCYSARTRQWQVFSNPAEWNPNQMYVDEMQHFLGCLDGEQSSALDIFEAARVLQIALAAKQSARQPRWIDLGSENWNRNPTS